MCSLQMQSRCIKTFKNKYQTIVAYVKKERQTVDFEARPGYRKRWIDKHPVFAELADFVCGANESIPQDQQPAKKQCVGQGVYSRAQPEHDSPRDLATSAARSTTAGYNATVDDQSTRPVRMQLPAANQYVDTRAVAPFSEHSDLSVMTWPGSKEQKPRLNGAMGAEDQKRMKAMARECCERNIEAMMEMILEEHERLMIAIRFSQVELERCKQQSKCQR